MNPSSVSFTTAKPVLGFTSSFLKSPPLEIEGCEDIFYEPKLHGTTSSFEKSGEFETFRKKFVSQLKYLINFAQDNHKNQEIVKSVREAFETLEKRLFDQSYDFYGDHKEVLYGDGKRAFGKLVEMLGNEELTMACRLDTVVQLADDVDKCADGAATSLANAANDLNLRLGGNEIYRLKEQVSHQLMLEYIEYLRQSSFQEIPEGMEIHYVNLLNNALADRLGLPTHEDSYINSCSVTTEEIDGCLQYILKHLTPARLACALADECLSQLDVAMQDHFAELKNGDTSVSFAYETSEHALKKALIPIKKRCGDVGIFRFISPLDDDYERFSINKDATLITLEILQSLSKRQLTEDYLPEKLIGYIDEDGIEIVIEHYGAQLIWATENDQAVLFTVEHLKALPHNIEEDVAQLAVVTAIKNSSPAMLLKSLSSNWLEEADTIQWVAKMDGETCLPFIKKHKTVIQKLSRRERFYVARGIVACGSVSAFKAYIADNQDLFDASEKVLRNMVRLWNVAAENKDIDMLDAVANQVLETIAQSSSVPASFLEMMARGLQKNVKISGNHVEMRVIASFHIGNILTKICEKGYIKPSKLAELFVCKDEAQRPALYLAMDRGRSEQVSTFGNVLLNAADKGALSSKQLFKLLQADHEGRSAFSLAMLNQDAATVTAFGRIVVSAYEMGFLDSKQAAALVAHKEDFPRRRAFGNDVLEAYGQILQDIDAIKAR